MSSEGTPLTTGNWPLTTASGASTTRPPLIFQAKVGAPPQAVFDAFFREPGRWLCREASIDPRVGGRLRMCWPDGCFEGRFVQCAPPSGARFTWRMDGDTLPETMVVLSLEQSEREDRTALELEHYGF